MKIECTRIRPGGTEVTLEGETYHFRPSATDARHIAEVSKVNHIKTLLGIAAYQVADEAVADMTGTTKKAAAPKAPAQPAKAAEPDPDKEGDGAGGADGAGEGGATQTDDGAGNAGAVDLDDLTDAQLRAAYQSTLGKAPGGTKRPKLIEALKAAGYAPVAA